MAGIATVEKEAFPDPTQFNKKSKYFDEKATKENPRWFCPNFKFKKKLKRIVTLSEMKEEKKLDGMVLLKKGSRLSVQPVTKTQYEHILKMAEK